MTFSVTFGAPSQVALSGCSAPLPSATGCVATATLEDSNGNTVTTYNSAVTFNQTNTGAGSVTGLTGTTSFTNGVANVTLSGNKVGTVVIDAVGDGFTSPSDTFSVTPGVANKLVITSAPFTATASTTTRDPFTITLEDVNGNATTSTWAITVNLAVSPTSGTSFYALSSGGSAVPSVSLPANASAITAYLVDFTSGSDTITASVTGGAPSSGTQVETINPGAASKVVLSGCTTSIISTGTCVATATLEDTNNNTVNTYNGGVTFSQPTGTGSVTGLTGTTTFTNGVANVTLTGNQVGTVSIEAVGDGFTSNVQAFSVTSGPPTKLVITSAPFTATASTTTRDPFTITLEDVDRQRHTSTSAITVNLAVSPTSGTSFYALSSGGSAVPSVSLPGECLGDHRLPG